MDVVVYLVLLFVWGLVVGAFARLALPGRDPLTIWQTIARRRRAARCSPRSSRCALFGQLAGFLLCLVFSRRRSCTSSAARAAAG